MPSQNFQLPIVTRVLADGVELVEAIGLPEVSALDDAERRCRVTLKAKATALLEDPGLTPAVALHRRRVDAAVELDSVEVKFDPPRRSSAWEEPVTVTIHYARWEADGLSQAYVPVLGIQVVATRPELLPERVREHVRLVLATQRKNITLGVLEGLTRVQSLRLGVLELTANLKTPRQLAVEAEPTEEKNSVLARLAEELPPVVGRVLEGGPTVSKGGVGQKRLPAAYECEEELLQVAEALTGPQRRSVLLIGPPGCGKTALVRELARRRVEFGFDQTPFWSTNAARLMSGPIGFGMWQQRCQAMCREASSTQSILHLGPLADLLEVGKASREEQSIGGFLRSWIARGDVLTIAECHPDQLSAIERNDPHLLGAFLPITLAERTAEQTFRILERVLDEAPGRPLDEPGQGARTVAALRRLQRLHLRYATYSANPGRPLRFLKNLLADQFPATALSEAQVMEGFSRETGLPKVLLDDGVPLDLGETRAWFSARVMGQSAAVDHVLDLLATVKACLSRPRKPLASFLFIGPTGTGKTEMAKALAEYLFGDARRLVRFDLNEFGDPISVQRLIGGPAAGGAEGLLTARVREQPFSVILLDEFEKADPGFFDLLLQVLGDGRLTDSAGRVADFCNSVIVMTSNLGAQSYQRGPAGFRAEQSIMAEAQAHFADAVRKFLRPEIYNRLDAIVPFAALPEEVVLAIARRHLELIRQRDGLRLRGVEVAIDPQVAGWLARRGHDFRYGARPLKRAIERDLLVPLAGAVNQYARDTPLHAEIGVRDDQLEVKVRARENRKDDSDELADDRQLAGLVVTLRRTVARLRRCPAASRMEDDVTLLESMQRRMAAARWINPELQERLMLLPEYRACLDAIDQLSRRAEELENDALGALYRREPLDAVRLPSEMTAIKAERSALVRRVFRAVQNGPDDVVLGIFGEPRETMWEFASAYFEVAGRHGEIRALEYFLPPPGGRSSSGKLVREEAKKPEKFFSAPPDKVVGVVFHVHGDLVFPRFAAEAGLHVIEDKKEESHGLIQAARLPLAEYKPPAGVDRTGGLQSLGESIRRTYRRAEGEIEDSFVGLRPWPQIVLAPVVESFAEERLKLAMDLMAK